jgi:hypothetical protein
LAVNCSCANRKSPLILNVESQQEMSNLSKLWRHEQIFPTIREGKGEDIFSANIFSYFFFHILSFSNSMIKIKCCKINGSNLKMR